MVSERVWRSSARLKKVVPWLVFLAVFIFFESHFSTIRKSEVIRNALETLKIKDIRPALPRHVLLIAYARTGSSFIGDLLQSLPDSFYFFEPLHFIRGPVLNDSFDEARDMLAKLFACGVSKVNGFLPWTKKHKNFMKLQRNKLYWQECSKKGMCYNHTYIEKFCRNKTTVIAKTIRFNLQEASRLFETHPALNLKIVYLLRDPRGTMNSRKKKPIQGWCKNDLVCFNSTVFCSRLFGDVRAVCRLLASRPKDFLVIRYEDVSTDAEAVTRRLVEFFGLPGIPPQMEEFLKTHTYFLGNPKLLKHDGVSYAYSTFRNSSATASSWRRELTFPNVTELQTACKPALKAYGYHIFDTVSALRTNVDLSENLEEALETYCQSENL